MNESIMAAKIV